MAKNIKPIETSSEFEEAKERLKALEMSMPGSPDEDEMKALGMAVEKWKMGRVDTGDD
jgi:predicted  nucleic acid-binding Zn-ribbon protein